MKHLTRRQQDGNNFMSRAEQSAFRILSGFGILCVVMGHFGCLSLTFDNVFPYATFHIPLFFFVSGYFFNKRSLNNILLFLLKKVKTLIFPFYIYYFLNLVIVNLLEKYGFALGDDLSFYSLFIAPWINLQPSGFMAPAWFVIAFFMLHVYNAVFQYIVSKVIKSDLIQDVISTIIYFIIGLAIYNLRDMIVTGFEVNAAKAALGLIVFWIGYLYKTYLEKLELRVPSYVFIPLIVIIRCVVTYCYGWGSIAWYALNGLNKPFIGYYLLMIISAMLGILFWLRISRIFAYALSDARSSILVFLGRHTYAIMSWHLLSLFLIQGIICYLHVRFNFFPGFDLGAYKTDVYYIWYADASNTMVLSIISVLMILLPIKVLESLELTKIQRRFKSFFRVRND